MKRLSIFLVGCLILMTLSPVAAMEGFHYENKALGFSVTIPTLSGAEIMAEDYETGVNFYHMPSEDKRGGLIGSIEVVTPRSILFSEKYNNLAYRVLSMGEDSVFLWKSPGGGVNASREDSESFVAASSVLSIENLRASLVPTHPDDQPIISTQRHFAYLTDENGLIRSDEALTRGELAEMLYTLLKASNKNKSYPELFADVSGESCAQAANYLASYGIFSGYADGTFRPDDPVSRAAFAVLLHRCQFTPPVGRYGDISDFADVSDDLWAKDFIYSAAILGWMVGDSNGLFQPNKEITRAEAVTSINRMLGRDEAHTVFDAELNPYSDLSIKHWAYENILEAAGVLSDDVLDLFEPNSNSLPEGASKYHFINENDGWAISKSQLYRTTNGGRTWSKVEELISFPVSEIFFFNNHEGLLLGHSQDGSWVLMQTIDGGESWSCFLENLKDLELHFPAQQFATEKSMLESITSVELRPASEQAIYLIIRYHPYESIYKTDLEAVKQTVISLDEISTARETSPKDLPKN